MEGYGREVILAAIAGVVGYVTSTFHHVGKLRSDVAFIKGQLSQIMTMVKDVHRLENRLGQVQNEHQKLKRDVDQAHELIRGVRETLQ